MEQRQLRYLRGGLLLLAALSAAGMWQFHALIHEKGWYQVSRKMRLAETAGWIGLSLLVILLAYAGTAGSKKMVELLKAEYRGPEWLRWAAAAAALVLTAVYPLIMFGELSRYFLLDWTRQALFVWLVVFAGAALAVWRRKPWTAAVPFAAAGLAVVYHLATYLPDISSYPFALGWSETTRYYLASTFFDQRIYGLDLPLVFRDFTRYLMQAVPFLVEESPLWVHRLWQAALRFGSTYFAGYLLARRYKLKGRAWIALFSAWAGLYFFQGPVFYNLMVNVLLVLWLVKPDRFWRALAAVVGISVWAGLSRINWFPMPGLMAAAFYLLEKPVQGKDFKSVLKYLVQPAVWVLVGTGVGLLVQQGYAMVSGNPEEIYYASFTSYLLWDRLLPNPSYRMGILPHVLLLTTPLLVYTGLAMAGWRKRWHFIRPLALAAIVLGLFAGGLIVSVKIGGGTNLHNMDVYFVMLVVVAAEIYFRKAVGREGQSLYVEMPDWLRAAVFAAPIIFVISYSGGMIPTRDREQAAQDLARIQAYVDAAAAEGEEVLFISQRHLITFGLIDNVTLVHAHEKLLLQEMAMSQNQEYLEGLGEELADQRYGLIVHDPLPQIVKDEETVPLAEENNVVYNDVTPLFTCAYQEVERLLDSSLSIFLPKSDPSCGQFEE